MRYAALGVGGVALSPRRRGVDRVVARDVPPRVPRPQAGRDRDQAAAPERDAHARERVAGAAEVDDPVTREQIDDPVPEVGPQR